MDKSDLLGRRGGESLEDFMKRIQDIPPHTPIPFHLTRDDYHALQAEDRATRMSDFYNFDGLSERELASQVGGNVEKLVEQLIREKIELPLGRPAFNEKFGHIKKHRGRTALLRDLKFIDDATKEKIDAIAIIRNKFAHDPDIFYYDQLPSIALSALDIFRYDLNGEPLPRVTRFYMGGAFLISSLQRKLSE